MYTHQNTVNSLSVKYFSCLNTDVLQKEILLQNSPHIVCWYIGTKGLKKQCIEFYRDNLILPLLQSPKKKRIYLVDLTAWGSFSDNSIPIEKESSHLDSLRNLHPDISTLSSKKMLEKMSQIQESSLFDYLKITSHLEFLFQKSAKYKESGREVLELMKGYLPELPFLEKVDSSRAYAFVQFLEAIMIIDEIYEKESGNDKPVTITFALPNDELEYYYDNRKTFQKALELFLKRRMRNNQENACDVSFISFPFGEKKEHRPYNTHSKSIKTKKALEKYFWKQN